MYLSLGEIPFLPFLVILNNLMKYKQYKSAKAKKSDPKLSQTKIALMTSLYEKYLNAAEHYKEILNWTVGYMEDPSQQVRNEASNLLLHLV